MDPTPVDDASVRVATAFVGALRPHLPEVVLRITELRRALDEAATLPPRLRELVRLRLAFHNQCRSCMALRNGAALDDGLTEEAVCALERPAEAPALTDAERSALRYADLFATDHVGIDAAVRARLAEHFDAAQVAELGVLCAYYVGFGRLAATLLLTDDLPAEFRESPRPGPWSGPGMPVR